MAHYSLLSTWLLADTSRTAAWETLSDVLAWPSWWPGADSVVELAPGDADRIGSRYDVSWSAALRYNVRFEFVVEEALAPAQMSGRASGDLAGRGVWRLFEERGVTAVTYHWDVRTTRPVMNALTPVARPVFTRGHDRIMRNGGVALAKRLGARVLSVG